MKNEKGRGVVGFLLMLALVVIVAIILLSGSAWPWIVANGTALINGIFAGNMASIVIVLLILVVLLFLFRRR